MQSIAAPTHMVMMLQLSPVPRPESQRPKAASSSTHAFSIVETHTQTRHDSAPVPYPMALVIALARGGQVRVPKEMESACEQLQQVYEEVLKSKDEKTRELTLVVRLLTQKSL